MPALELNKFYWGMSDTDLMVGAGQFIYWEQLEFRKEPNFIQLKQWQEEVLETWSNLALCVMQDPEVITADLFFWCEWGEIYAENGNLVDTVSGNHNIVNSLPFNGNFLFFYKHALNSARIGKIAISDATTWTWSRSWQPSYDATRITYSIPQTSRGNPVALNFQNSFLYRWAGNAVKYINTDPTPVVFDWLDNLPSDVVWLTQTGTFINVYLRNWLKYIWDGVSANANSIVDLRVNIRNVYNIDGNDYILAWSGSQYSELYISVWLNKQLLKKAEISSFIQEEKFSFRWLHAWNYPMANNKGIVYLQSALSTSWRIAWVSSFGSEYSGFPISFSNDVTQSLDGNEINRIWFFYNNPFWSVLYYSYEDVQVPTRKICKIESWTDRPSLYAESGFMYSPVLNMWSSTTLKRTYEVDVRAQIPQDCQIVIKILRDWSTTEETIATLTNSTSQRQRRYTLATSYEFFDAVFRVELSTTNNTVTPTFYWINLRYEAIEQ